MKTVLLLRHADIDVPDGPEPPVLPLNALGQTRARELARILGGAGVTAVFVSPILRTHQTAAPLTTLLGFPFQIRDAVPETVQGLLAEEAGPVVVVVGHSNTIPAIVSFKIATREVSHVTIVDLTGRIILGNETGALRDAVRGLVAKDKKKIILNLADVDYIDSAGVGELVGSFTTVRNSGGELKLLNLTTSKETLLRHPMTIQRVDHTASALSQVPFSPLAVALR